MASVHKGSCSCGAIKIEFEGDPPFVALCHCLNCHKTTSSTYSTNWPMPRSSFKLVSGEPKTYEFTGGSGNTARRKFCGECSCVMWTESVVFPEFVVIKAGIVDDEGIAKFKPTSESFVARKPSWVPCLEGAKQFEMSPQVSSMADQLKKS